MTQAGQRQAAVVLADGRLLIGGGYETESPSTSIVNAYDPAFGAWSRLSDMRFSRTEHTYDLLLDGTVLVTGGFSLSGLHTDSEIYDPETDEWRLAGLDP